MGRFERWCDPDGYGNGTWGRHVEGGLFHVIEVTDMAEACGRDNDGHPKYVVELCAVDLDEITDKLKEEAKKSCGWEGAGDEPRVVAEMCRQYGAKALLHSVSTNSRSDGFRSCRKDSYALTRDRGMYEERMSRPVNAIGSSARECMQGDVFSAVTRGVAKGRADAKLLAKIHGVPEENISLVESLGKKLAEEGTPPEAVLLHSATVQQIHIHNRELEELSGGDVLPYVMGYQAGIRGRGMDGPREELADSYLKGYKHGVSVRLGEVEKPAWIS